MRGRARAPSSLSARQGAVFYNQRWCLWPLAQAHRLSQDTGPLSKACVSVAAQGDVPSLQEHAEGRVSPCSGCVPAASGSRDPAQRRHDRRLGNEGVNVACVSCVQVSFTLKVFVKGKWWVPSASHPVPPPLLPPATPLAISVSHLS